MSSRPTCFYCSLFTVMSCCLVGYYVLYRGVNRTTFKIYDDKTVKVMEINENISRNTESVALSNTDRCIMDVKDIERTKLLSLTFDERNLMTANDKGNLKNSSTLTDKEWNDLFSLKQLDKPRILRCKDHLDLFDNPVFAQMSLFYVKVFEGVPFLYKNIALLEQLGLETTKIKCTYSYMDGASNITVEDNIIKMKRPYTAVGVECKANYSQLSHLVNKEITKNLTMITFYRDIFTFINKEMFNETRPGGKDKSGDPAYNVLMLVLDSVSWSNAKRSLPYTLKYMKKHGGLFFQKLHRLGENSWPNYVPLLTGRTISYDHAGTSDTTEAGYMEDITSNGNMSWAWEPWKSRGLPTIHIEDFEPYTLFNYWKKKGWKKVPFMYYFRSAYRAMRDKRWVIRKSGRLNSQSSSCINNSPLHKRQFELMKMFVDNFQNVPYFAYSHLSEYSHDHDNFIANLDKDLALTLEHMDRRGHLDRTLFILMADHGKRMGPLSRLEAGIIDSNNPFFIIRPPPDLESAAALEALHHNKDKVTTMQDIHKTITDPLITRVPWPATHPAGHSLFSPLPARTCEEAEVPPMFCACTDGRVQVDTNDSKMIDYSYKIVSQVNEKITNTTKCRAFSFNKIEWATELGGLYILQVSTKFGNNSYVAIFQAKFRLDHWPVVSIVRADYYAPGAACLKDKAEQMLRPWCVCKV